MIVAKIKGQDLTINQPVVAANTVDFLEIEFQFSGEWYGLAKIAHVYNDDEDLSYDFILKDDKITRDMHLNLSEGVWEIWVQGNEYSGEQFVMRITTDKDKIKVKGNDDAEGGTMGGIKVPQSVAEQILGVASDAKETAEKALKLAEGSTDAGLFEPIKIAGTSFVNVPENSASSARLVSVKGRSRVIENRLIPSGVEFITEDMFDISSKVSSIIGFGHGASDKYCNIVNFDEGTIYRRCVVLEATTVNSHSLYTYIKGMAFNIPMNKYDDWIEAIETVVCSHAELSFEYVEVTQYGEGTISSGCLNVSFNGTTPSEEELQNFIDEQKNAGTPVTICYGIPDGIISDINDFDDIIIPVGNASTISTDEGIKFAVEFLVKQNAASQVYVQKNFANAIKGFKKSESALLNDVSPFDQNIKVVVSSENINEIESVVIKKYGKNLSLIQKAVLNGAQFPPAVRPLIYEGYLPNGGTLSWDYDFIANAAGVFVIRTEGQGNYEGTLIGLTAGGDKKTSQWIEPQTKKIRIEIINYANATGEIYDIQLELTNEKTDYETYIEPVEYTPNYDGSVIGVNSIYPVTTLMTDTQNVVINCEYNRDANKVIADLETKLNTLVATIGGE